MTEQINLSKRQKYQRQFQLCRSRSVIHFVMAEKHGDELPPRRERKTAHSAICGEYVIGYLCLLHCLCIHITLGLTADYG